jgi:hypothetical protein
MSYDHAAAIVYVGQLADERHPALYDLCRTHVNALSAPRGWVIRREPLSVAGSAAGEWHQAEPVSSRDVV